VARQPAAYDNDYDYEYDYSYDYSDEDGYVYDAYSTPYAANARAALPSFMAASLVEPHDLPLGEQFIGDLPPGEVLYDDLPAGEDIVDDMPPPETGATAPAVNDGIYGRYTPDYDHGCDYDYDYNVQSYGDYPCRASQADAGQSLRPLLRTASWLLNHMGEMLMGLSKSCEQMADAAVEPADDSVRILPPTTDYPWPTIIGRQPRRNQTPGL
jgi:hypothetical protein